MKKKLCFIILAKPSKVYDEKFSFVNIKKKFNLKIISLNKLLKGNQISMKTMDNLKNDLKRFNTDYVMIISNYNNEKKLILRELKNTTDIKLIDHYLGINCFEQNIKNLWRVLKLNLINISHKNLFLLH